MSQESACNAGNGFDPWLGKILWRRSGNPVFLPGESHGQRSLVGYCPRSCKDSYTTEAAEHAHMQNLLKIKSKMYEKE